ncbi:glycosyltransferase family 2 protein [Phocaeicola barnesiae]|uniref:glycosyltransferase family 2 protein n=1 Tax=Phocaeicola barnesiae TaxID=376804 RepID=UPI00241C2518|nr:glycosyltransferase family 2 protein [Phocaeicola barnesiae]
MLDISVVILTYNEELHIRRCLENVNFFAFETFVIDCFSTDKTVEIAKSLGATVVQHTWPGNQAEQFNWALDNLDIRTNWILRLDADEYVSNELIEELNEKLPHLSEQVSAVVLPLGRAFLGRVLKHGIVNGIKMIRLFRAGKVRYEIRLMDEHLKVLEGEIVSFNGKFIDDNRDSLKHFIDKHNNYSSREAALLLDAEYEITKVSEYDDSAFCQDVQQKRLQKRRYASYPLFWRAFGYFVYRYFFKLGFLDGKEGFLWDFLQGWWYRTLVDAKVFEIKKACGTDKEKIKQYLKEHYNISL